MNGLAVEHNELDPEDQSHLPPEKKGFVERVRDRFIVHEDSVPLYPGGKLAPLVALIGLALNASAVVVFVLLFLKYLKS